MIYEAFIIESEILSISWFIGESPFNLVKTVLKTTSISCEILFQLSSLLKLK